LINATSVLGFDGFQDGIASGDVSHGAAILLFMLPVLFFVVIGMLRFTMTTSRLRPITRQLADDQAHEHLPRLLRS
jgi:hypothetical protein